ncbi:MAG TPA: flagellar motor protein MotB [Stellaceae bacterium]|nr:flagellar motor protein MotB [Stellaceae bacterium]
MAIHEEPEKPPNHERWIISYADFTTLLLATFVVMYAVSSINSSKFQEMAEAFSTAFMGRTMTIQASGFAAENKSPFDFMPSPVHLPIITRQVHVKNMPIAIREQEPERAKPHGRPDQPQAPAPSTVAPPEQQNKPPASPTAVPLPVPSTEGLNASPDLKTDITNRVEQIDKAFQQLRVALAPLIGTGQVHVSLQSLGVVIDINEVLLFNSGKADLTPKALPLVDQIALILKGLPYQIQVNGFTDNAPIHNVQFDSNWDLSATRAISVVKRFVTAGVDPTRLVGAGFGKYHPIASNATAQGKAMNRRVSIVVVSPVQRTSPAKTPMMGPSRTPAPPGPPLPAAKPSPPG